MDISHSGKVALVTGGSRGIGLAIAEELAASGAIVHITGRKAEHLQLAADRIGCEWTAVHAADDVGATTCVDGIVARHGHLDILVNNAGINPQWGPTIDVSEALARKLVEVNQWAPLHWTQCVWRSSMSERGGSVLNISSVAGVEALPRTGYYGATKAALGLLTRQLAGELAPGVRVNAIAPGLVDDSKSVNLPPDQRSTLLDRIPLGRLGTPRDIALAASFLVSDAASWITGQVLAVDGGTLVNRVTEGI
jgi:NAD(P)-dependent dehydrogenase (short-subunit alcohol dehydrogenase family)